MPHSPRIHREAQEPDYVLTTRDVQRYKAKKIFMEFVRGADYEVLALRHRMTIDGIRKVLGRYLRVFHRAYNKWLAAEEKCRKLAIENRRLKQATVTADDNPIQALNPPARLLPFLLHAGIDTVGKLRAATNDDLEKVKEIPTSAKTWAIFELESRGLSHNLIHRKQHSGKRPRRRPLP